MVNITKEMYENNGIEVIQIILTHCGWGLDCTM